MTETLAIIFINDHVYLFFFSERGQMYIFQSDYFTQVKSPQREKKEINRNSFTK